MCGAGESSKEAAMKEIKPPNLALEKIRSVIRKVRLEVDEEKYFLAQKYFSPSVQWLVMCGDLARSRPRDHRQWWSCSGGAQAAAVSTQLSSVTQQVGSANNPHSDVKCKTMVHNIC